MVRLRELLENVPKESDSPNIVLPSGMVEFWGLKEQDMFEGPLNQCWKTHGKWVVFSQRKPGAETSFKVWFCWDGCCCKGWCCKDIVNSGEAQDWSPKWSYQCWIWSIMKFVLVPNIFEPKPPSPVKNTYVKVPWSIKCHLTLPTALFCLIVSSAKKCFRHCGPKLVSKPSIEVFLQFSTCWNRWSGMKLKCLTCRRTPEHHTSDPPKLAELETCDPSHGDSSWRSSSASFKWHGTGRSKAMWPHAENLTGVAEDLAPLFSKCVKIHAIESESLTHPTEKRDSGDRILPVNWETIFEEFVFQVW